MGKPLMLQEKDDERIEDLKEKTGLKTKIDVVRTALDLLASEVARRSRVKRWQNAVKIVGDSGLDVLADFKTPQRFKKLP
jgi:hypothetical protein